jgi:hypothetical protein
MLEVAKRGRVASKSVEARRELLQHSIASRRPNETGGHRVNLLGSQKKRTRSKFNLCSEI